MSNKPKEFLTNMEINSGSILLFSTDEDEILVRNWQNIRHEVKRLADLKPVHP